MDKKKRGGTKGSFEERESKGKEGFFYKGEERKQLVRGDFDQKGGPPLGKNCSSPPCAKKMEGGEGGGKVISWGGGKGGCAACFFSDDRRGEGEGRKSVGPTKEGKKKGGGGAEFKWEKKKNGIGGMVLGKGRKKGRPRVRVFPPLSIKGRRQERGEIETRDERGEEGKKKREGDEIFLLYPRGRTVKQSAGGSEEESIRDLLLLVRKERKEEGKIG